LDKSWFNYYDLKNDMKRLGVAYRRLFGLRSLFIQHTILKTTGSSTMTNRTIRICKRVAERRISGDKAVEQIKLNYGLDGRQNNA
jgi:hypothetical protein